MSVRDSLIPYRLRLAWERRKLALAEAWLYHRSLPLPEQFKREWLVFLVCACVIYGVVFLSLLAVTFL